jgi:hypothetical protein
VQGGTVGHAIASRRWRPVTRESTAHAGEDSDETDDRPRNHAPVARPASPSMSCSTMSPAMWFRAVWAWILHHTREVFR